MKYVFFDPWIGRKYQQGINGKRIWILGHVHVCGGCEECGTKSSQDECSQFTNRVITDYLTWKKDRIFPDDYHWQLTYESFEKAFNGKYLDEKESFDFWDSIMFSNFVQSTVPEWDALPSQEQYDNSQLAFWEILKEYNPDLIIVWGNPAFYNTPGENCREIESLYYDNISAPRWVYELNGHETTMIKIHHPSCFFSWRKYHEIIKQVIL